MTTAGARGFRTELEPGDAAYDPFEEFNRVMGAGEIVDPYPDFAAARAHGPFGDLAPPPGVEGDAFDSMVAGGGLFCPVSFRANQLVLRDGETFSSKGYEMVMGPVMGHTILEMDEPEHHRYRGLVQQAFTRQAMERWEADLVRPVVDGLIDAFADRGHADLVRELTFEFSVRVIAGMFGIPDPDLPWFHRRAIEIIGVSVDMARATTAATQMGDYLAEVLADHRAHPAPAGTPTDILTVLADAELDGHRLTDEEIFSFCRLLLPAGAETTYRSTSNLLLGLLTNTGQLDAVRTDRSLVEQAVEEGLRWEPPLLTILRTAAADTVIEGVALPAGSIVLVNMGAANRDDTRWPDPDSFDIFRERKPHLAFAHGPHACLGMHLARMESRVVLERVLDRLPGIRLDPAADPRPQITGMPFRAPATLPVVWDA